jgi:hypothetical protein
MLTRRRPWPPLERARSSCGRREIWELLRRAGAEQGLLCRMDRRSCLGGGLVVSVSGQWRVLFIGRDAALVWPPIGSQACFLLSIFLKKKLAVFPSVYPFSLRFDDARFIQMLRFGRLPSRFPRRMRRSFPTLFLLRGYDKSAGPTLGLQMPNVVDQISRQWGRIQTVGTSSTRFYTYFVHTRITYYVYNITCVDWKVIPHMEIKKQKLRCGRISFLFFWSFIRENDFPLRKHCDRILRVQKWLQLNFDAQASLFTTDNENFSSFHYFSSKL